MTITVGLEHGFTPMLKHRAMKIIIGVNNCEDQAIIRLRYTISETKHRFSNENIKMMHIIFSLNL